MGLYAVAVIVFKATAVAAAQTAIFGKSANKIREFLAWDPVFSPSLPILNQLARPIIQVLQWALGRLLSAAIWDFVRPNKHLKDIHDRVRVRREALEVWNEKRGERILSTGSSPPELTT